MYGVRTLTRQLKAARCHSSSSSLAPWFVDKDYVPPTLRSRITSHLPLTRTLTAPLPDNIPKPLRELHAQLTQSPHLEPGALVVRPPIPIPEGPPLPESMPKGRRKRGRSYFGEGVLEPPGGIWNWVLMAQVKEGTENRGAIESVVRIVRKVLLSASPPLPLPPNSKRLGNSGWAMVDAGEFAVHVMSKEAQEKFFTERARWEW